MNWNEIMQCAFNFHNKSSDPIQITIRVYKDKIKLKIKNAGRDVLHAVDLNVSNNTLLLKFSRLNCTTSLFRWKKFSKSIIFLKFKNNLSIFYCYLQYFLDKNFNWRNSSFVSRNFYINFYRLRLNFEFKSYSVSIDYKLSCSYLLDT